MPSRNSLSSASMTWFRFDGCFSARVLPRTPQACDGPMIMRSGQLEKRQAGRKETCGKNGGSRVDWRQLDTLEAAGYTGGSWIDWRQAEGGEVNRTSVMILMSHNVYYGIFDRTKKVISRLRYLRYLSVFMSILIQTPSRQHRARFVPDIAPRAFHNPPQVQDGSARPAPA